jgi:hypothetical protein
MCHIRTVSGLAEIRLNSKYLGKRIWRLVHTTEPWKSDGGTIHKDVVVDGLFNDVADQTMQSCCR